jgi:hypothetical protein
MSEFAQPAPISGRYADVLAFEIAPGLLLLVAGLVAEVHGIRGGVLPVVVGEA